MESKLMPRPFCGSGDPTTGEIVRALGNPETLDQESLYYWSKVAADRLESQAKENEISRHLIEMQSNVITELTARAEQAEAFIKCAECKNLTILNTESVYAKCHKRGITFFPFDIDTRRMGCMDGKRGLPQDGEKRNG